jgi:hypothetical protein
VSAYRCQICGRRTYLKKDGTVAHHHVVGAVCPGTGYPPIEHDDARLIGLASEIQARSDMIHATLRTLDQRRANWIDPALVARAHTLDAQLLKLTRRLTRHLNWPARYKRSMEKYGWAMPPPPYLVRRMEMAPAGVSTLL